MVGNPNLRNEKGDTWTLGMAFRSPAERPLLGVAGTLDWYKARVGDPINVLATSTIVNSCYNINGLNPSFSLDDPNGYCSLIERDPVDGGIERGEAADELDQAIVRAVDELQDKSVISDSTWATLSEHLDERQRMADPSLLDLIEHLAILTRHQAAIHHHRCLDEARADRVDPHARGSQRRRQPAGPGAGRCRPRLRARGFRASGRPRHGGECGRGAAEQVSGHGAACPSSNVVGRSRSVGLRPHHPRCAVPGSHP